MRRNREIASSDVFNIIIFYSLATHHRRFAVSPPRCNIPPVRSGKRGNIFSRQDVYGVLITNKHTRIKVGISHVSRKNVRDN